MASQNSRNSEREVSFEYFAPVSEGVFLAGSFNGWNPALTPMKESKGGRWSVSLKLAPGRYEYRFWADGAWHNDQNPVECVPNAFGTWNCVITVS
ncbi:MAG: glycoside hydrolase family 13 [Candidatus Omnitrophica bacterium]|nr:glycoside hydrolase family 13 [Candidatus Omnitrophota bacterium]